MRPTVAMTAPINKPRNKFRAIRRTPDKMNCDLLSVFRFFAQEVNHRRPTPLHLEQDYDGGDFTERAKSRDFPHHGASHKSTSRANGRADLEAGNDMISRR
jgi:hypothetical protein